MKAELHDVSVRLGLKWVLAHVTASFPEGSTTLLLGGNGAGKTTLLRTLATLVTPRYGTLSLSGELLATSGCRDRIGLMTHDTHLYDALDGRENLTLCARLRALDDVDVRVRQCLEDVGLATVEEAVGFYSAGMKRRLCLARLALFEPELVLLDEPFAQLDTEGVVYVERYLERLAARKATVVLATHDVDRGRRLSQRMLKLNRGRVLESSEDVP